MSRIRTIKPEFCTSEQVGECSTTARLLFALMWIHCDDAGNHPAKLMQLKAECFPMDSFDREYMAELVSELTENGLLIEYVGSDGLNYWHVTGWHHQRIDKPKVKYPEFDHQSAIAPRGVYDSSKNGRRSTVPESTVPEGNVSKGTGQPAAVSVPAQVKRDKAKPASVDEVKEFAVEAGLKDFDAQHFWNFYQSKGWKVGREPMKDWRAAARNAHRNGWCSASQASSKPSNEKPLPEYTIK